MARGRRPGLLAALTPDEPPALRRAAVEALGPLGHLPAVPALVTLAGDEEEPPPCGRAVTALGRIGGGEAIPVLLGAARSNSETLRLRAAETLVSFRTEEVITALTDLAADAEPKTAEAAVDSLARIGPRQPPLPARAGARHSPGPAGTPALPAVRPGQGRTRPR
ncbi:HEAT repeat domain-containing protein [Streptomyces sp. B93]|uniref:HEAT repeat domain-containing protein n=1 Tax=Streptomyces sp. B93 TaxID=2824875 RepID=UPI001B396D5F|nr:HEAT repeat domain-containing protein [Streptomyces sp. B93]